MVVRGVPRRLAKDAWWLDDAAPQEGLRRGPLLLGAIIAVDLLVYGVRPGLGMALWFVVVGLVIAASQWRTITRERGMIAAAVLAATVLPMVEVVQFGTFMVALSGLAGCALILSLPALTVAGLWQALLRLPVAGLVQTVRDLFAVKVAAPSKGGIRAVLFDWALPLGVGAIFLMLFAAANPVIDRLILMLGQFDADVVPEAARVVFWLLVAAVVWPLLRIAAMRPELTRVAGTWRLQSGLMNARSVLRALILFNLIFLSQSVLDLGYLWGGFSLPEGMSYATYAHRGAYPLLVTALLAGLFALLAQPYLGKAPWVRWLLYLWIAQNILLVVSSILRLDLYVDAYGLTRLRVAAFVWMVVVALGLVLIVMQLWQRQTRGWFMVRAAGLGFLAIYACNLWNIDGLIARHNLSVGKGFGYVCSLGEGAVPALRASEAAQEAGICYSRGPHLSQPVDWREWGYRNARLRASVAAMETAL